MSYKVVCPSSVRGWCAPILVALEGEAIGRVEVKQ